MWSLPAYKRGIQQPSTTILGIVSPVRLNPMHGLVWASSSSSSSSSITRRFKAFYVNVRCERRPRSQSSINISPSGRGESLRPPPLLESRHATRFLQHTHAEPPLHHHHHHLPPRQYLRDRSTSKTSTIAKPEYSRTKTTQTGNRGVVTSSRSYTSRAVIMRAIPKRCSHPK